MPKLFQFKYGVNNSLNMDRDHIVGGDLGCYGDGSDGDVHITGSTSNTREMFYENLEIDVAGTLAPTGYRIFIRDTLMLRGSITADGSPGSAGAGGLGAPTLFIGGGSSGGAGGVSANGSNGSILKTGIGSNGGSGGGAGVQTGGSGGSHSLNVTTNGGIQVKRALYHALESGGTSPSRVNGGSGGGGGAGGSPTGEGGGGGGGAGVLVVCARRIIFGPNASITANGGDGADAVSDPGGGGGGGGAGAIILITSSALDDTLLTGTPFIQSRGGFGGSGLGIGSAGTVGTSYFDFRNIYLLVNR